jgi:hypothetical protein
MRFTRFTHHGAQPSGFDSPDNPTSSRAYRGPKDVGSYRLVRGYIRRSK